MTQAQQLAHRFEEVLLNGKWVTNTNFKEILEDITFKEAVSSYNNFNSIALLTFHINFYIQGVLEFLEGGELTIKDAYSFDMPVLKTESDWGKLRTLLLDNAHSFAHKLSQLPDENIEDTFVKEAYGNYNRNINGMVSHCYYHLGQIVLLKKLIRS